jgi:uncharacterized protein
MDITPKVPDGRQVIESYDGHGFKINGAPHIGSVIIWPEDAVGWTATSLAEASAGSLDPIFAVDPRIEILLIGTGARFALVPATLKGTLQQHRIAVESMDTGAACRTYNVLMSEDRRVAAALLPAISE